MDDRPLHPLDGRREAPDSMRMAMRGADGAGAKRPAPSLRLTGARAVLPRILVKPDVRLV